MKSIKMLLLLLFVGIRFCIAQDTTLVIKPTMLDKDSVQIFISEMKGWLFKQGNDTAWARKNIDLTSWKKLMPTELSEKLVDKDGRVEGWFRIKIMPDSSFGETSIGIRISSWAASDLYIDGNWIASFGNTGLNGLPYLENNFKNNLLPIPINLKPGNAYTIVLHLVDYKSPFPQYFLKAKEDGLSLKDLISITVPKYYEMVVTNATRGIKFFSIIAIVSAVLCLLFWLLYFQNRGEKNLFLFALAATFLASHLMSDTIRLNSGAAFSALSYNWEKVLILLGRWSLLLFLSTTPFIFSSIFKRRFHPILKSVLIFLLVLIVISGSGISILSVNLFLLIISIFFSLLIFPSFYFVFSSWKTMKGAQWAIVVGLFFWISIISVVLVLQSFLNIGYDDYIDKLVYLGMLSFLISLIIYVAIRFKEIIQDVQENARQVVQMSEEKKEQAINQQKILQEEVNRQTAEIRTTLDNLKSTQHQLIQSEKMASLGELTAGIAHEIQNPLNFVNNFSEVSTELVDEMNEEIKKGNIEDATAIAADLKQNLEKINHHGKRAGDIVKGMLQHSRSSSGTKEPTDINALADEYLRLAYHGLRAKDKSFNATMKTEFDESIGSVNIVPQDIGRVILNLITNAFYVVNEKKKSGIDNYEPTVSISTSSIQSPSGGRIVQIKVSDNGGGIPPKILDKIFQPFFTTKPTGQGTGLGLSLSYDIVKAHGGELKVETKEGEGTTFIIQLPV